MASAGRKGVTTTTQLPPVAQSAFEFLTNEAVRVWGEGTLTAPAPASSPGAGSASADAAGQTGAGTIRNSASASELRSLRGPSGIDALEKIGCRTGERLAERWTAELPRIVEVLDALAFIGNVLWPQVYSKTLDAIEPRDGSAGRMYVLKDARFLPLSRMSGRGDCSHAARVFLQFPAGLIRGVLEALGWKCTVRAKVTSMPGCSFTVKVAK